MQMITKELMAGRIEGPFPAPPSENFICSPIGLREKREKGKYRLIHDLSHPHQNSVNSNIPQHATTVKYQTLDHVITLLQQAGKGASMAKADIQEAFRLIPMAPKYYHMLGFQFQGQFYFDKCLPMGMSSSCQIFERLSTALHWILEQKFGAEGISHILDDFIFISPDHTSCLKNLNSFIALCGETGIPIKKSKTCLPSTKIEAHGVLLDSELMQARLPSDKVQRCKELLLMYYNKRKLTLKQLQSLIGTLQFATRVIAPGRAFLRRLINLTIGIQKPYHHITISREAREDMECWLKFLNTYNGVTVFLHAEWVSSDTINLYADAAGSKGYAIVYGHRWLAGPFPQSWESFHINIKELYPIVLAINMWGHMLINCKIMFHTDNQACMHIINTQTSKDKLIMKLVRSLVLKSLTHNILFRACHVPGKINTIPDLLSRFQFQQARQLAPWLAPSPEEVPTQLQPQNMLP